jgi:phage tail-like protein
MNTRKVNQDLSSNPYCYLFVEGLLISGYFYEFTNFGKEFDVIHHRTTGEGGQDIDEKVPGRLRYKRITLKRYMTDDLSMWAWRRDVEVGDMSSARKNCTLTAYDAGGAEVANWTLTNAWPIGVFSERDSNGTNLEVVTLVTETFVRVS